ncbi:MAG: FtsH protease activity modulator HflK [Xanthomonadales bacterium]|nr:FtsH protease activity modulator HflK [Xanthomonadales bacterium]
MAWNEPGDGNDKGSKGSGNQGNRGQGADVDAFLERLKSSLGRVFGGDNGQSGSGRGAGGGSGGPSLGLIILAALMIWLVFDSWTLIDERQRGVVLRFGKYDRLLTPGPGFKLPRPFESVIKVDATQVRNVSDQVRMLTRDENIVLVDFNVQYQVSDPVLYLFGTRDPDETLQQAAESAVREVMGNSVMDTILSGQRAELASQASERLQAALDQYRTGLTVSEFNLQNARPPQEVKDAFDDAIIAREDKQRFENDALGYASKQVPEARGAAARIKAEAEAYKASVIAHAEGDADRFTLMVDEYRKAPEVTRKRLYLETMQDVLAHNPKVVLANRNGNNVIYLPLDKLSGGGSGAASSNSNSTFTERLPAMQTGGPQEPSSDRSRSAARTATRNPREGSSQ